MNLLRSLSIRLAQAVPVLLLATVLVFLMVQVVPGDPAAILAGQDASQQRIDEIRAVYGLDRSLLEQYLSWLMHLVQGDMSRSLMTGIPVGDLIAQRLPNTLLIVTLAILISIVIGVPIGIVAAMNPKSPSSQGATAIASLGVALPNFWLAMVLVSVFAVTLGWFPAIGMVSPFEQFGESVYRAFLPACALAAGGVAEITRQLRSALTEIIYSQHIRTLRAKGLTSFSIYWKHGLKNVGVIMLTVIGLLFNRMLGATVVIESVFAIPGIGSTVVQAAIAKDLPIIQGITTVTVLLVILSNFIVDTLCSLIDPRVDRVKALG